MIHQPCNTQKTSQIIIIHAWGRIVGQLALLKDSLFGWKLIDSTIEKIFSRRFWAQPHISSYNRLEIIDWQSNKASWPTMRPQACMIIICVAFWVLHGWLIISQRFLLAGVETGEEMRNPPIDQPTDQTKTIF